MTTNQKIGIGCGIGCTGMMALLVCGGIALLFWADQKKESFIASMNAPGDEGKKFAETNDAEACVVEALTREGQMDAALFLFGCLDVAKRPDGFCDVPRLASTMKEVDAEIAWRKERCEKLGHPDEACQQLIIQQQMACER